MEFVERFGAKATKATQAQSKLKQIRKLKPVEIKQKLKNAKIFIQPTEPRKTFAVKAKDLVVGYGDKIIASNGNFEVDRGQKVAILGENGAGKSTLLKTLGGKLEKKDGTFTWNNRMELAYYDQFSAASLHPKDTIGDYLTRSAGYLEAEAVLRMAGAFLFKEEDLDKTVSVLSGGERARLVLAGILLQAPDALLLDEPTNHLDLETVETLANALSQWNGTVLFISHSRSFVNQLATRIFEVKNGEIRNFPGTYEEYLYAVSLEAGIPQDKQDEVVTEAANKKERHEKRKELLRTIQKLEKQLEDLEQERENIMKSILTNPTKIDVERDRRLQTLMTILSHTESEWLKAQEELQKIEER
jgi:ATP-binding cassette subfamily F protein 3